VEEVEIAPLAPERFRSVLVPSQYERFQEAIDEARRTFAGRTIWNVNSTAYGGGVAEMLHSVVGYIRGAGLDARWLVISGDPDFYRVTKRIHNHLHGSPGDGGRLDDEARLVYESALAPNAEALRAHVRRGDYLILHDPQTAGLVPAMRATGAHVVWRCHVGLDMPNDLAREAWSFLLPYVREADAYVFSRAAYVWEGLSAERVWLVPPSLDAFSPKNIDLDPHTVQAILDAAGITAAASEAQATFPRHDGSHGVVRNRAEMVELAPVPAGAPLVLQVSRWDRLKDPAGVVVGFAEHLDPVFGAHLVLAGPSVEAVADDPEGGQVLRECIDLWRRLPDAARARVHLACLPMRDAEENAAMVNALQRRADIVVQKSLAEGFGLTVAEAMWKGRPVVASRIGGIQDQIDHGRTGLLLDDPHDLAEFGDLLAELLRDPPRAAAIGQAAQETVRDQFLGPHSLMKYARLLGTL
jgi:trehalose synthase